MAIVSLVIVVTTLAVCDRLKHAIKRSTFRSQSKLLSNLAVDFILGLEQCIGTFELGVLLETYGVAFWALDLICVFIYQILRWSEFGSPSPNVHIVDYFSGSKGLFEVAIRVLVLLISGSTAFAFVNAIWSLELSVLHVGRPDKLAGCRLPWADSGVSVLTSALTEFSGSLFLNLAIPRILESQEKGQPKIVGAAMAAVVGTLTVLAAFNVSGGFYNPMLATAVLSRCQGYSWSQHIFVYWISCIAGAVLADKMRSIQLSGKTLENGGSKEKAIWETFIRNYFKVSAH